MHYSITGDPRQLRKIFTNVLDTIDNEGNVTFTAAPADGEGDRLSVTITMGEEGEQVTYTED